MLRIVKEFPGHFVAGLRFLFGFPMQRAAEPDLEDAFPLGGSHIVPAKKQRIIPSGFGCCVHNPPQSISAGITFEEASKALAPISHVVYRDPTVRLMKYIEQEIQSRIDREMITERTDERYDEPVACYPEMKE
jgi:hypothetical protein